MICQGDPYPTLSEMMSQDDLPLPSGMTEQQTRWFSTLRVNLERDTGKTLGEWVEIARTCPEVRPRARAIWMRDQHGLGANRAAQVLSLAFPSDKNWDNPEGLRASLWHLPESLAVLVAIEARLAPLTPMVSGQRQTFTSFSRKAQFAALRPTKAGGAMLGLALPLAEGRVLRGRESWSERLQSKVELPDSGAVDARIVAWLSAAWEAS